MFLRVSVYRKLIKITENFRAFIYHANSLLIQKLGIVLFEKAVYFINSFFNSLSIQEGGLFKRAVLSRAYGNLLMPCFKSNIPKCKRAGYKLCSSTQMFMSNRALKEKKH